MGVRPATTAQTFRFKAHEFVRGARAKREVKTQNTDIVLAPRNTARTATPPEGATLDAKVQEIVARAKAIRHAISLEVPFEKRQDLQARTLRFSFPESSPQLGPRKLAESLHDLMHQALADGFVHLHLNLGGADPMLAMYCRMMGFRASLAGLIGDFFGVEPSEVYLDLTEPSDVKHFLRVSATIRDATRP
jgi:hypothetical protein